MRRRVPDHLRAIIGKLEVVVSYGPISHADAVKRHHQEMARVTRAFADAERTLKLRQGYSPALNPAAVAVTDVRNAAARYLHLLERDEAAIPFNEDERLRLAEIAEADAAGICNLQPGDLSVQRVAKSVAASAGLGSLTPALAAELDAAVYAAMVESAHRAVERLHLRPDRQFDPRFAAVTAAKPPAPTPLTVKQAIAAYQVAPERAGVSPKTRAAWKFRFRTIEALLGPDKPVTSITRADVRKLRDDLALVPPNAAKRWPGKSLEAVIALARREGLPGMSAKSLTHYSELVGTLFRWLEREDYIPKNIASGVSAAVPTGYDLPRRPFTVPELNGLIASPAFRALKPVSWLRWSILIALFSGMRLAEVVGIGRDEVVERDGVLCFDVRPNALRTLKTAQSARLVPVHPELDRMGLRAFLATVPAGGALFLDLPGLNASRIAGAQRKLSRFLRKVFPNEPALVFHSFRHTWTDAARAAYVPREIMERLGGWSAPGSAMSGYGDGWRPAALAAEIAKLHYNDLQAE